MGNLPLSAAMIAATLLTFVLARRLSRRLGSPPWASPVLLGALFVGLLIAAARIPAASYGVLVAPLTWVLKPAVIALGALLWDARATLRSRFVALLVAVTGGVTVGVASAVVFARLASLPPDAALAFATRTVTTPFAVAIHAQAGGPVALAAAFAVLGGVVGTIVMPPLLRLLKITDDASVGTAMGVSSHLVGTDWLARRAPVAAAFSGAAMVLLGVVAALVLPWLWPWLAGVRP